MFSRLPCLAAVALAAAFAAGPAAAQKTTLTWRGDVATANGVVTEVAKVWEKGGHGRILLQPFNTAGGIDAVASGTADLAGSARPADGSAQNANLTFTPVAWDGLVLITNAQNPIANLTLKQVHDIYYGRIHNWAEVGGRSAPIDVYAVASPGDGVEYSLRTLLFGRGNQPVAAPRLYVNTKKLEEGIALNPNGFGVAMLSGVSANPKIKTIPVNGRKASLATVENGSYPLYIPLYLVSNPRSPKAAEVETFIRFLDSDPAKAALRRHGVLPFSDGAALAAADTQRRDTIWAEVGVRNAPRPTPVSAPGATYAARSAIAPTSADTLAARRALEARNAGGYKVAKGDTLASVAAAHGVSVDDLRRWNHLKKDKLKKGQLLRVSGE